METLLQVENLTKKYPAFKLDDVSFVIPKGTIMGIIGENGAGKSTIINAVLDIIKKDSGKVLFWGRELSSSKEIKENIGVVFDSMNFYETMTPYQIEKISRQTYKQWNRETFISYLKKFNLPEKKEIKEFSKGMKMKLSIAAALSHNPKLLILDEATGGAGSCCEG